MFSSIAPCLSRFLSTKSKSAKEAKSSNTLPLVSTAEKKPWVPLIPDCGVPSASDTEVSKLPDTVYSASNIAVSR